MLEVYSFYAFIELCAADLESLAQKVRAEGDRRELRGLFLIAPEGMNATFSGEQQHVEAFGEFLRGLVPEKELAFKVHTVAKHPFRRWQVAVREEIVTIGSVYTDLAARFERRSLSPAEWQHFISSRECSVVDTRNWYEVSVGKFRGAVDPGIRNFGEFPKYVEQCGLPKQVPVLMYCTGGVRCEKAQFIMEQAGFKEVYQLEGGILKYLEEFPRGAFEGECFVFDHRVALDSDLQPSRRYDLCPHCGNPAEIPIMCADCGKEQRVCGECRKDSHRHTCSKACAHRVLQGLRPRCWTASAVFRSR